MKLSPEYILLNDKLNIGQGVFLFFGPEEALIRKACNIIVNNFKSAGFEYISRIEGEDLDFGTTLDKEGSLFFSKTIYIYNNPKKINFDFLEKLNFKTNIYIIIDSKLKSNSQIKKKFDNHKIFFSIGCYDISFDFKKKYIDSYISKKKVKLDKNAYWFFLENSGNSYYEVENELIKIELYNKETIFLSEIKTLLNKNTSGDLDDLFFSILKNKNILILKSKSIITSHAKAQSFLYKTILYLDIIAKSKNVNEVGDYFPKYLFKQKNNFLIIYNKINKKKLVIIYGLIKKTEILIRKNSSMYLLILQRFLLNLKKELN